MPCSRSPGGSAPGGSARGVPAPGGGGVPGGGPAPGRLLLRAVRILLECILILSVFFDDHFEKYTYQANFLADII